MRVSHRRGIDFKRDYACHRPRQHQARLCFDPFHVVALANFALDNVRRQEWQALRRAGVAGRWLPRAMRRSSASW
jgi:transposase